MDEERGSRWWGIVLKTDNTMLVGSSISKHAHIYTTKKIAKKVLSEKRQIDKDLYLCEVKEMIIITKGVNDV